MPHKIPTIPVMLLSIKFRKSYVSKKFIILFLLDYWELSVVKPRELPLFIPTPVAVWSSGAYEGLNCNHGMSTFSVRVLEMHDDIQLRIHTRSKFQAFSLCLRNNTYIHFLFYFIYIYSSPLATPQTTALIISRTWAPVELQGCHSHLLGVVAADEVYVDSSIGDHQL